MESKIEATDRLRREGRWSEASAFRDQERQRMKESGSARQDATEGSWRAMIEKFPPLPVQDPPAPALPLDTSEHFSDGWNPKSSDVGRDILWVYDHIDWVAMEPNSAPTAGAWHLLSWARENRDRFFEVMLPKAMKSKSEADSDEEHDRKLIDLCRVMEECVSSTCPHCGRQFRWDEEPRQSGVDGDPRPSNP